MADCRRNYCRLQNIVVCLQCVCSVWCCIYVVLRLGTKTPLLDLMVVKYEVIIGVVRELLL